MKTDLKLTDPCPKCFGHGFLVLPPSASRRPKFRTPTCKNCKGTGRIPKDSSLEIEDIPDPLRIEIRLDDGTGLVTLRAAGHTDIVVAKFRIGSIHRPHANCHRIGDESLPAVGDSEQVEKISSEIVQRLAALWNALK